MAEIGLRRRSSAAGAELRWPAPPSRAPICPSRRMQGERTRLDRAEVDRSRRIAIQRSGLEDTGSPLLESEPSVPDPAREI
jgi:hypothetical protein